MESQYTWRGSPKVVGADFKIWREHLAVPVGARRDQLDVDGTDGIDSMLYARLTALLRQ